jgi:predicted nucleic acid-binding Zn ribbon protein
VHSLGSVLGGLAEQRVLATGLVLGRLAARWDGIVGPRLASETTPVRLDRGVLVIAASTQPWAAQVRFLEREIAVRASTRAAPIREIRVVVRGSKGAV